MLWQGLRSCSHHQEWVLQCRPTRQPRPWAPCSAPLPQWPVYLSAASHSCPDTLSSGLSLALISLGPPGSLPSSLLHKQQRPSAFQLLARLPPIRFSKSSICTAARTWALMNSTCHGMHSMPSRSVTCQAKHSSSPTLHANFAPRRPTSSKGLGYQRHPLPADRWRKPCYATSYKHNKPLLPRGTWA